MNEGSVKDEREKIVRQAGGAGGRRAGGRTDRQAGGAGDALSLSCPCRVAHLVAVGVEVAHAHLERLARGVVAAGGLRLLPRGLNLLVELAHLGLERLLHLRGGRGWGAEGGKRAGEGGEKAERRRREGMVGGEEGGGG